MEEKSLEELKALAFDLIRDQQIISNNLQILYKKIEEKESEKVTLETGKKE